MSFSVLANVNPFRVGDKVQIQKIHMDSHAGNSVFLDELFEYIDSGHPNCFTITQFNETTHWITGFKEVKIRSGYGVGLYHEWFELCNGNGVVAQKTQNANNVYKGRSSVFKTPTCKDRRKFISR